VQLVLVRHGHAGTKEGWPDDDRLRPLDARGRRQAEHLAQVIVPLGPVAIVSSPYMRCLQTVAPLAARTHLTVEEDDALVPDGATRALPALRLYAAQPGAQPVVLCTHGEVMGEVLQALAREDGLKVRRRTPGPKGCAWVLDFKKERADVARYIAPAR
jgi:broad specificity phosphatase PhoE